MYPVFCVKSYIISSVVSQIAHIFDAFVLFNSMPGTTHNPFFSISASDSKQLQKATHFVYSEKNFPT